MVSLEIPVNANSLDTINIVLRSFHIICASNFLPYIVILKINHRECKNVLV